MQLERDSDRVVRRLSNFPFFPKPTRVRVRTLHCTLTDGLFVLILRSSETRLRHTPDRLVGARQALWQKLVGAHQYGRGVARHQFLILLILRSSETRLRHTPERLVGASRHTRRTFSVYSPKIFFSPLRVIVTRSVTLCAPH